jgi:hypothetical protein
MPSTIAVRQVPHPLRDFAGWFDCLFSLAHSFVSLVARRGFVSNTLFGRWPQKGAGGEVMSEYVLHQTSVQSRHAIYPDVRVGDPKSDGDAPPAAVVKDASAGDSTPNSPQLVHSLLKVRDPR